MNSTESENNSDHYLTGVKFKMAMVQSADLIRGMVSAANNKVLDQQSKDGRQQYCQEHN